MILRRSGRGDAPSKSELYYYHFDDQCPGNEQFLSLFSDETVCLEGVAGEACLVDPFGLHRGLPLLENERLLFWSRYSLYHDGNALDVSKSLISPKAIRQRVTDDRLHRYMLRTFVESEFSVLSESGLHLPSCLLMDPPARMHQLSEPGILARLRGLFSR